MTLPTSRGCGAGTAVSSGRRSTGSAKGAFPVGWRVRRACVLAFLAGVSSGCYRYVPVQPVDTRAGMEVRLDVNDSGRVALAAGLGPSVSRIEGSVRASPDTSYLLSVSAVEFVSGERQKWSGEPLSVRIGLVRKADERRFSKVRTTVAIVVGVGALLAFALSRDLMGSGSIGREPPDPGPGPDK